MLKTLFALLPLARAACASSPQRMHHVDLSPLWRRFKVKKMAPMQSSHANGPGSSTRFTSLFTREPKGKKEDDAGHPIGEISRRPPRLI